MSTVTKPKRHARCLRPSTSATHSTAQPTLTEKFSGSHGPVLISHCFSLFLSFCVSRVPKKQENVMRNEKGGWEGRYNAAISLVYWPCVRLQASGTCAAFQWKRMEPQLSGLHTRHSLLQNNMKLLSFKGRPQTHFPFNQ